jgi:hypothetical protein
MKEITQSHVRSAPGPNNAATGMLTEVGPQIDLATVADMYSRVRAQLTTGAFPRGKHAGYRLFTMTADQEPEYFDLRATARAYAVLGRHTRCDVPLPHDPQLSLRHLLARATPTEEGAPVLQLFDLRAQLPVYAEHATALRTFAVRGPCALRLGRYALIPVPLDATGRPEPLPERLPETQLHQASAHPRELAECSTDSYITQMPDVSELVDFAGRRDDHGARLTLQRRGREASIALDPRAFDRGVMVGRADRCVGGGLRSLLTEEVSRAHLMLLRERSEVRLYDLCSTNGTRASGKRVRSLTLPDAPTSLNLAGSRGVVLHWEPPPK